MVSKMRWFVAVGVLCVPGALVAQWELQDAHTTASLRGIHSLGGGVAWASGTGGTVLRTEDGGANWQKCAVPSDAAKLDFRGVQGLDAQTAVVMSSGKGDLSRLYRTTDGCKTWKKVFDDPDETGFFDSLRKVTDKQMYLLGDPVKGKFSMFFSQDGGVTWFIADDPGLDAAKDAGAFAASNTALINVGPTVMFGTGGPNALVYTLQSQCPAGGGECTTSWKAVETPLAHGSAPQGVFSLAGRFTMNLSGKATGVFVAVGGTYDKPDETTGTAAFSRDGGASWVAAASLPHGYRSAVTYDSASAKWIAVGPNGTDVSADDGKTWVKVEGGEDRDWNALSLPFVVGPKGRIGKLKAGVLKGK